MVERKEEEELNAKIILLFKRRSIRGDLMLTIPEVAKGLGVDRRKVEPPLLLLSKGKSPKLAVMTKGRVKYYSLKEVIDFCQKWAGEVNDRTTN